MSGAIRTGAGLLVPRTAFPSNIFWSGHDEELVALLKARAQASTSSGLQTDMPYIQSCTADVVPPDRQRLGTPVRGTGIRIIFTRDEGHHTSGWFKNPDYERCFHLSTSFFNYDARELAPQSRKESLRWVRLFYGDDARYAWAEPPASPLGKRHDAWHYRVFCDAGWQPIKPRGEVYSLEFTELGWKSFSELGTDVDSPLYPG
jgi:hypothetical protein